MKENPIQLNLSQLIDMDLLSKLVSQFTQIEKTDEPPQGTDKLICVVAVSSVGEISVISEVNRETAAWYYSEDCQSWMEEDFDEPPGIYLVQFWADGERDYWGEYDSWSNFDHVTKYKIDIADKRKDNFDETAYDKNFATKDYKNPGSELPRCLFIVNGAGRGIILDVLNEEEAYKIVLKEVVHNLSDCEGFDEIECLTLCEADLSIKGDMDHLFDRDMYEGVSLSNIKKINLVLGDKTIDVETRNQRLNREWAEWGQKQWEEDTKELRKKDNQIL